jgi:hypothetical protein
LEVREIINDGDLHWNTTVKHWVAVTPQGEERVAAGQHGLYCARMTFSRFKIFNDFAI